MIEYRPDRRSPHKVKRHEGQLSASFVDQDTAEFQDALWGLWHEQIPALANQPLTIPTSLQARLLDKNGRKTLAPGLLAELLAAHPARAPRATPVAPPSTPETLLFGEFIGEFFPKWAEGRAVASQEGPKAPKTIEDMEEWVNKHLLKVVWVVDPKTGYRLRDANGERRAVGWGADALAWNILADLRPKHFVHLFETMASDGVGREVRRKFRSFLGQGLQQAALEGKYPDELKNPVTALPAPQQSGVRVVRKPMLPTVVELIRADLLELDPIIISGAYRSSRRSVVTPANVPIPVIEGYGQFSADLVEMMAYAALRPGEALGSRVCDYAPEELGADADRYLHVKRRDRDGIIIDGTKSRAFPEKLVHLLGPLPLTLARLTHGRGLNELLLPYPGTTRPMTSGQYRYWRERFFAPIARRHGLGPESDDPYALRHVYATLRLARHDSIFEINQSMGTSLAGKTYGEVKTYYEGKGPLGIDAEIHRARLDAGLSGS